MKHVDSREAEIRKEREQKLQSHGTERNGTEMETETEWGQQRMETTKLVLSPLRFPSISDDNGDGRRNNVTVYFFRLRFVPSTI